MDADRLNLSFGRYLRAVRLERGIDLKAVAVSTRISPEVLRRIEAEDHAGLPAEVFVKGFLRAYARQVGADGDAAVALYLASREQLSAGERFEKALSSSGAHFWPRLLLALLGLALIISLSLLFSRTQRPVPLVPDRPSPQAGVLTPSAPPPVAMAPAVAPSLPAGGPSPTPAPVEAPSASPPLDAAPVATPSAAPSRGDAPAETSSAAPPAAAARAETHLLQIVTVEETWLKVIVDNHKPKEYMLKVGDRLDFEAHTGFNLLIGNAGGIRLALDGAPVAVPGRSGRSLPSSCPDHAGVGHRRVARISTGRLQDPRHLACKATDINYWLTAFGGCHAGGRPATWATSSTRPMPPICRRSSGHCHKANSISCLP